MAGYLNGELADGLCLKALPEIELLLIFILKN